MSTLRHFQGNGKLYVGSASITVAALTAADEADYTITDDNAEVTDVIVISPINAAAETGLAVLGAWCSTAGTISVRLGNVYGSTLTGGANLFYYSIIKTV